MELHCAEARPVQSVLRFVSFSIIQDSSDNDDDDGIVGMPAISISTSAVADNDETKYPVYSASSPTPTDVDDFKSFFAEAAGGDVCRSTDSSNVRTTQLLNRIAWQWSSSARCDAATNYQEKMLLAITWAPDLLSQTPQTSARLKARLT